MKKIKLIITLLIINGFLFSIFSQTVYAQWGKNGVFIELTKNLNDIKNGEFHIIKKTGNKKISIGKTYATKSKKDFINRLNYYIKFLPDFKLPSKKMINRLWKSYKKNNTIDSLYFWGTTPVVKLSLGIMFIDSTAENSKQQSYFIEYKNAEGKIFNKGKTNILQYKHKADIGKILFKNVKMQGNSILLSYSSKPKYPSTVQVYRRTKVTEPFQKIHPIIGLTFNKTVFNILIIDSNVDSGLVYQYYITPVNRFNLEGNHSDTTFCGAYDFSKVFLPLSFIAESSDSLRGLKLTWEKINSQSVKGIVIERSNIFDSLFNKIAELPAYQTEYIDYNIEPMKKYFYRMKLVGPLNEETQYSARIFGMYKDNSVPLPPFGLSAKGIPNGIQLKWFTVEPFIKGFYLYRNNNSNNKLKIIAYFIPLTDTVTVFIDSSSELKAGYSYMYSVVAENTSHIKSPFSDTVSASVILDEKLIPPTNLQAVYEKNGIQLYWDNMRKINKTITGYFVYKAEKRSNTKLRKIDSLLFPESNNYFDKKIIKGKSYVYAVQSVGINDNYSKLSERIIVKPEVKIPLPPSNIQAKIVKDDVLISWEKPFDDNISTFNLYRFQRGMTTKKLGVFSYKDKNEYLDKTVSKGNLYFYYIISVSKEGAKSKESKEVGIRVQ